MALAYHREMLASLCRVCGETMPVAQPHQHKVKFTAEISEIYDVDVLNEDEDVYPQSICLKDLRVLYRCRKSHEEHQAFGTSLNKIKDFEPHSEQCGLCYVVIGDGGHDYIKAPGEKTGVGRPRKKQKRAYGKGAFVREASGGPTDSNASSLLTGMFCLFPYYMNDK